MIARLARTGLAATLLALASFGAGAAERPLGVVELFTSQGCSSCPPADRLLGRFASPSRASSPSVSASTTGTISAGRTPSTPDNSARQRAYAARRGDGAVYTPQVVINGRDHVLGSDEAAIRAALKGDADTGRAPDLDIEIKANPDAIEVTVPEAAVDGPLDATLWLVTFEHAADVAIDRGENRGKSITYHNVVRSMRPIGMWKGKALTATLPRAEVLKDGADGCAVILQDAGKGRLGPVLGAAILAGSPR
ncbi:MAG: DUF1223 domain-containing protein [Hyphomicrobiales bacterium]